MGKIAFLFSGQGAQYPGMGKSLCEASEAAKAVFDLADSIRSNTSAQCFSGTKEELSRTENTQPCVYCVDLAAAEALKASGIVPDVAAGFSERTNGGMAAVLKLSDERVEELCAAHPGTYPVNYNCPGQVSVAGEKTALEGLCKAVQEAGGRAVPLAVSGGFHSPMMDSAAAQMQEELQQVTVSAPVTPLYANYTAEHYAQDAAAIKQNIAMQVNHPVPWQAILKKMADEGVTDFVEVGPGKTLAGLVKKTLPGVSIHRVEDAETLQATVDALK